MNKARFEIVDHPINIEKVIQKVVHPNAGAVNSFIGTVREMTKDKRTVYLKYEAYVPMALKQFQTIEEEVLKRWPDARIAITHRIGELKISETAVVIAVSTPHRAASFEACRYAIERLKEIVPIWKKEHWSNGESWIGDQKEKVPYDEGKPKKELGL
ncbi:MAG: molybdenum cofactor biosynthesis protein MoaE [Tuberibacillus sp.]